MGGAGLEGVRPPEPASRPLGARRQPDPGGGVGPVAPAAVVATGQMGGWDIVIILAWTLVLTWVYNGTGGSVLIVMLFHAMYNTISGGTIIPALSPLAFSGADSVRKSWLLAAVWCAVA